MEEVTGSIPVRSTNLLNNLGDEGIPKDVDVCLGAPRGIGLLVQGFHLAPFRDKKSHEFLEKRVKEAEVGFSAWVPDVYPFLDTLSNAVLNGAGDR